VTPTTATAIMAVAPIATLATLLTLANLRIVLLLVQSGGRVERDPDFVRRPEILMVRVASTSAARSRRRS
jgi:hypothetical protein